MAQDDARWMGLAVDLAKQCPPSEGAYSVGAVIVDEHGQEISRGYSRENDPYVHAEEAALAKLPAGDPRLARATITPRGERLASNHVPQHVELRAVVVGERGVEREADRPRAVRRVMGEHIARTSLSEAGMSPWPEGWSSGGSCLVMDAEGTRTAATKRFGFEPGGRPGLRRCDAGPDPGGGELPPALSPVGVGVAAGGPAVSWFHWPGLIAQLRRASRRLP